MSIDAYELYNSRKTSIAFDKQTADLEFFCRGTTDDALARAAIIAITPATFFGLPFENLEVDPLGGGCWLGHAKFSSSVPTANPGQGGASPPPPSPPAPAGTDPLGPGFSFDISTFTENIKQAKQTVASYGLNGDTPPDTKGVIGQSIDGEVKGCERISPKFEWSVTRKFGYITLNYYQTLFGLVGTYNNASFYGFDIGECLCIGASGSIKDTQNVEVTLKFACQPNETNIEITDELTVSAKKGWDYLDIAYMNVPGANIMVMQPFAAYVYRIYDAGDFSQFGIGG